MNYVFDLDGTICTNTNGDYVNAVPIIDRVKHINELFDKQNNIVIYTARGMGSSNNNQIIAIEKYYSLTKRQLIEWNVKHHQLVFGKPFGDVYIDDKGINDNEYFK